MLRKLLDLILYLLIIILIISLALRLTGFALATVSSGSMIPTLNPGDVVLVRKNVDPASLRIGDIVVYRDPAGRIICHRIVARTNGAFVTKGDNNPEPDDIAVTPDMIIGKVVDRGGDPVKIPRIGIVRYPSLLEKSLSDTVRGYKLRLMYIKGSLSRKMDEWMYRLGMMARALRRSF